MFRFARIRAFDALTYTADVELEGAWGTLLPQVPVAWHVREDLLTEGTRCLILLLDELSGREALVLALFSGRPADDPRFDPLTGHRHRGMRGDGPSLT